MKKISIGLLPRILIAIVLGIVLGNVLTAPLAEEPANYCSPQWL